MAKMLIPPFERSKTKDGRTRDKVAIVGFRGYYPIFRALRR